MGAAVMRAFGPPSVLRYEADFPRPPALRPGEVLVKVAAASINPIDWKTRKGEVPRFAVTRPKILGGDVAGVVEASQSGKFKPGERVFGCTGQQVFWSTYGTYAELVVAHESSLLPIPAGTSFQEAAAVPLAAMTAWQAMEPSMPLANKRVLVHAGAGGVGSFAIQIAKAQGAAFVATTCSGRNLDFTRRLGADRPIDYTSERFEDASAEPYDLVVDLIGGDYELRSLPLLKRRGGHFAHVLNSGWLHQQGFLRGPALMMFYLAKHSAMGALGLGPSYALTVMRHQADRGLAQVAELMAAGKLKVTIEAAFPLAQAAEAQELVEAGHVRGKVVLQVADLE